MEKYTCIYCKNEILNLEDSSVSDIIPYAFMGKKKLQLKDRVCKKCNGLINKNAENYLISKFSSLRRRVNPISRRKNLENYYKVIIRHCNSTLETNEIKTSNVEELLKKPLHYKDKKGHKYIIGPLDSVKEYVDVHKKDANEIQVIEPKCDRSFRNIFY